MNTPLTEENYLDLSHLKKAEEPSLFFSIVANEAIMTTLSILQKRK